MLYKKKDDAFSTELFQNPTSEYRGTPFWAWNDKLTKETILEQVDIFHEMGFGGFHMHVRTGLDTPYLSDEYIDMVKLCNDKAKKQEMLSWLYDEDRWPSGAAGGYVTSDLRFRQRCGRLSPAFHNEYEADRATFEQRIEKGEKPIGYLMSCYRLEFENGLLKHYERMPAKDYQGCEDIWYVYMELDAESPWFNNQTYVNTLDKKAIEKFVSVTHERYYKALGEEFSKSIPAIFTDEPQFKCKQTFDFAGEKKDLLFPFTDDLPETFLQVYGYDLMDRLPEVFWETGNWSQVRYHYHDHLCDRFTEGFSKTVGDWCSAHDIMLTGHVNGEQDLTAQTYSIGEAMRSYPHFKLPGIDMLMDRHEFSSVKQAQSVAHQCGAEGVLSELYGVTNWDFDFKGHKLQGDWQAALGVTVRVPHLSWMTMRGEAKRDYPASIFYQSPWYKEYKLIEDHFARVNTAMTRGKTKVRVGVIHPIESFWLLCGPKQQTEDRRRQAEKDFSNLVEWLLFGLIDFDFIDESLLPSQFQAGSRFHVGEMAYDAVVVPPCITLRRSTLERLEQFAKAGGDLIFFGDPPELIDALPSDEAKMLYDSCRHYAFNKIKLLNALEQYRTVDILNRFGFRSDNLLYQLREEKDASWLFISHVYRVKNWYEHCEPIRIIIDGIYTPVLYNTMDGTVCGMDYTHENGRTIIPHEFYAEDSLLIRLEPPKAENGLKSAPKKLYLDGYELAEPIAYTLSEPNALLLDMAEYALNGEEYRAKEELLRIGNFARRQLGYPTLLEAVAQPWVIDQKETPKDILSMRITVDSEIECAEVYLAIELDNQEITWNGRPVELRPVGYFTDKCIQTIRLNGLMKGENELIVKMPFGKKTNVEWLYLLGDFGVSVCGVKTKITAKPEQLYYGSTIHQGLPFYSGNITYHTEFEADGVHCSELFVPRFCGPVLSVELDGEKAGTIAFAPHTLDLGLLPKGKHSLAITIYGNRVNAFGCVHNTNTELEWYGPDCWRSEGNSFAYQYQLRPFGITQNVHIRRYKPM